MVIKKPYDFNITKLQKPIKPRKTGVKPWINEILVSHNLAFFQKLIISYFYLIQLT